MENKKLKLVVASGKGGVGKSMLCSALAMLFSKSYKTVAVDCDVDAPNLAIWLDEKSNLPPSLKLRRASKNLNFKSYKVSTSSKPIIDYKKCIGCGLCVKNCRFNALKMVGKKPKLNPFLCEGCGACEIICPQGAIKLKPVKNGEIRVKQTKYGFHLISGQLFPGETGSGKIVSEIKKVAEKYEYDVMLIDSSPGTGCPVIAALRDADFTVLICEPTPSGFSDLKRVLEVVEYFKIPYGVVINKWDINPNLVKKIEQKFRGKLLGKISYDKNIFKAISNLTPILETNLKAKKEIEKIYKELLNEI